MSCISIIFLRNRTSNQIYRWENDEFGAILFSEAESGTAMIKDFEKIELPPIYQRDGVDHYVDPVRGKLIKAMLEKTGDL